MTRNEVVVKLLDSGITTKAAIISAIIWRTNVRLCGPWNGEYWSVECAKESNHRSLIRDFPDLLIGASDDANRRFRLEIDPWVVLNPENSARALPLAEVLEDLVYVKGVYDEDDHAELMEVREDRAWQELREKLEHELFNLLGVVLSLENIKAMVRHRAKMYDLDDGALAEASHWEYPRLFAEIARIALSENGVMSQVYFTAHGYKIIGEWMTEGYKNLSC